MKHLITLLFLLFTFSAATASEPDTKPIVIVGDPAPTNKNNRPKAPSLQHISCWYDGEYLHFSFALPEGECLITVTDTSFAFAYSHTASSADDITIHVGNLTHADITILTAAGNTYSGQF